MQLWRMKHLSLRTIFQKMGNYLPRVLGYDEEDARLQQQVDAIRLAFEQQRKYEQDLAARVPTAGFSRTTSEAKEEHRTAFT